MNLKTLTDQQVDQNLFSHIEHERETTKTILLYIIEVDRRKLHLKMNYPTIFEYLTKRMKYPNGTAHRRIEAAKLSLEVPSVLEDLEKGDVHLYQVTLLQKCIKDAEHKNKAKITKQEKSAIVQDLKNKSKEQTEMIIAKALNIEIKESPKVTHQADGSVVFQVCLSDTQWEKMEELRRILSTALPNGRWDQVLEYIADKEILRETKVARAKKSSAAKASPKNEKPQESKDPSRDREELPELRPKRFMNTLRESRKGWHPMRRAVLQRDKCCQNKIPGSEQICGSKWNLQVDHVQPLWAGGADTLSNLQTLCANHNREKYRRESNIQRK
jgi:hypothetical protein